MTDRIAEAARATRKYEVTMTKNDQSGDVFWNAVRGSTHIYQFNCRDDAQDACDRLNLLAALEALREPSEGMVAAGVHRARRDQIPAHVLATNWRAMIDAAIKEVRKAGNDA